MYTNNSFNSFESIQTKVPENLQKQIFNTKDVFLKHIFILYMKRKDCIYDKRKIRIIAVGNVKRTCKSQKYERYFYNEEK